MKLLTFLLSMFLATSLQAVELFGVDLSSVSRDQLKNAVKKTGFDLIRESGKDSFYDVYDSRKVMPDSRRFYLGFVKKDSRFAFAEYEFTGIRKQQLLRQLTEKYGKPVQAKGKFLSDTTWSWNLDPISISLVVDWQNYRTRLIYKNGEALRQLKQEQQAFRVSSHQQKYKELDQML